MLASKARDKPRPGVYEPNLGAMRMRRVIGATEGRRGHVRVLFIKTSSLGDVIHHMPALTEAHARRPDRQFVWVVEEAFAPFVRLHPAV